MLSATGSGLELERMALSHLLKAGAALLALSVLVGCEEEGHLPRNGRHYVPIPGHMVSLMSEKGTTKHQPILVRAYKKESELEIWKQNLAGDYVHLKTYPMCRWSGQLGPKVREGDRQVPEGFYSITPAQLNPNSSYYLSFNVGYPNAYDRSHGRTGNHIMVHGACSSMGCFSMTDEQIAEIYAITREAFAGGQKAIQLQSFPFRFTPQNMAKFRADPNMPFWKTLKEGSDSFEVSKRETQVSVCERRYVFNRTAKDSARFEASSACPPSETNEAVVAAVSTKARADDVKVAELIQSGTRAVRRIYKDGDQHESFKSVQMAKVSADGQRLEPTKANVSRVAEVSRPDDLEHGPVEIPVDELKGKAGKSAREIAASLPVAKDAAATGAVAAVAPAVPAKAAAVAVPAAASAPVPAAETARAFAPSSTPFYQGWLGFGSKSDDGKTESREASQPQPVNVPLPPKAPPRQAGGATVDKLVETTPPAPERRKNVLAALFSTAD